MERQRGQWSSGIGFILAAAGSAIGLGNLWKFPYISYENNGGAFVLVYIGAVLLVGIPIMVAEIYLGRRTQKSPVGAFLQLSAGRPGGPLWAGAGILGVVAGFTILSYYSVIAGWTPNYIGMSLTGELGRLATDPQLVQTYFLEEFLADGGKLTACHLGFMAMTTMAVFFGVKGGIERAARILMPILLCILVSLVIYVTTTPGFSQAITFLFRPNFSELTSSSVLEALGHAFFTLSLGMGAMLTYGSYIGREMSIPRSALWISGLDTVIAIMACIIMFSVIFSFDFDVQKSSTILFTTLPAVFIQLPGGQFVTGVFYLLVAFAALTSTISLLEVVCAFAIDQLGWTRRRAAVTTGAGIAAFGVLNALSLGANSWLTNVNPLRAEEAPGLLTFLDYLATNWFLPVGGLLTALFVGWFLDRRQKRKELECGHGDMRSFGLWHFLIRFAAPLAVGAILVSVILGREYQ